MPDLRLAWPAESLSAGERIFRITGGVLAWPIEVQNIFCKCSYSRTFFGIVMPSKVYSAAVVGVNAFEIEIEVHAGWGPDGKIAVVGLPDTAVKESRGSGSECAQQQCGAAARAGKSP
jgi:hypothetical protein